ncbi:MAG: hypothetical protein ACLVJO_02425 [[Clostridium] scindens]
MDIEEEFGIVISVQVGHEDMNTVNKIMAQIDRGDSMKKIAAFLQALIMAGITILECMYSAGKTEFHSPDFGFWTAEQFQARKRSRAT